MQLAGDIIKQVTIFNKSGICILSLDYRDAKLDEDLFSSLLSAITGFSREVLGFEPYELVTTEYYVFLKRTEELILAMIAEEAACDDRETKSHILSLVEKIGQILESSDHSWTQINTETQEYLEKEIKQQIIQAFPTFRSGFTSDEQFVNDIGKIRILTQLSDQKDQTAMKIANQLHLPRSLVEEKLSALDQGGFITIKAFFRQGEHWTYAISERGKLALDALETEFPGLWF